MDYIYTIIKNHMLDIVILVLLFIGAWKYRKKDMNLFNKNDLNSIINDNAVEGKKEPWLGIIFSYILPGLGYFYAENKIKGLVVMFIYLLLDVLLYYSMLAENTILTYVMFVVFPASVIFMVYQLKIVHSYIRKENPRNTAKLKDEYLAAFLSMLFPGLGQLYVKKIIKGVLLFLLYIIAIVALDINAYYEATVVLLLHIVSILDAYKTARKLNMQGAELPKVEKKLICIALAIFFINGAFPWSSIIKEHIMQFFTLPTGSMESTLLIGDHLIVSKYAYKIGKVKRFDIVVFKDPKETGRVLVKRCVGVPGDKVEIRKKKLYINGIEQNEPYTNRIDTMVVKEFDEYPLITVPNEKYFFLGDNRAVSYDSRHFGLIDEEDIVGKPIKIWLPLNRIGPVK
ncbi:MAG: signal peptidase I [Candidatus Firestonebacteria bacterium RIFOXYC2_FULL_39_67]|nr:MAG: signal peptidase I [Candidatus Firestonebacteria bacterium RIFOXYD2_FULL_39_29]OGF54898.1 MAG: signal peptidase I [Candidatus Firestonebacteria bacterium RIFOXYC2_FULL_39_67]